MAVTPSRDYEGQTGARAPEKLSVLTESVLTILAGRCRHSGISIQKDFFAGEPFVLANGNQIRQVVINLIINAIEAMPTGGTITVAIRANESNVGFHVLDTGLGVGGGMDVFDAFATNKPGGIGLGLYLSKQIVDGHQGKISYHNRESGAEFWFELPIATETSSLETMDLARVERK